MPTGDPRGEKGPAGLSLVTSRTYVIGLTTDARIGDASALFSSDVPVTAVTAASQCATPRPTESGERRRPHPLALTSAPVAASGC